MIIIPVILGSAVLLAHIISAFTLDRRIEYKIVPFHLMKAPKELNGYKIAFISDTHNITERKLKEVVLELNKLHLDLLILGGDFPSNDDEPRRSMEILSKVETTDGIYGVEGTHDNYTELFEAMERYSIHPLSNSGVYVRERFFLAGVEDIKNRRPNVGKALEKANPDSFVLLITHNPDVTMLQNTASADLILSGHTHGGHITLFGLWPPALTLSKTITKYGTRFMTGWGMSRENVPVYVSNGMGCFAFVPRIFARPQAVIITLL